MGSGKESKKNNDMFQLASSDEAKYNRLKSKIIENADTFVIFYMRLLNVLFLLLSIFFIIYDSIINKRNMVNLDKYLNENLLFNHSKISSGILYLEYYEDSTRSINIYKALKYHKKRLHC